ncbi:uncharacterized protein M421DRAFT_8160 [Didymella exigua CBS 183.55]|uniref:Uncharacterized protein n=1 Tax=Didymella exigua CBS 183.55 TaxID=1150837 RepID=A0A6A5RD91_9PLEO|nr:uncharacterized protein M421DRAFT_8160 [Didymella exigua CBS 183.55]KAF1925074.1 hypothetical protein M421DRAFT_8160 [Didymella exigua CBS 183.55]
MFHSTNQLIDQQEARDRSHNHHKHQVTAMTHLPADLHELSQLHSQVAAAESQLSQAELELRGVQIVRLQVPLTSRSSPDKAAREDSDASKAVADELADIEAKREVWRNASQEIARFRAERLGADDE